MVEVASRARTGLALATAPPAIDVVILDIGLPDIAGLEGRRGSAGQANEVAILMLTARDTVGDRVTGLDAGADDYLVKPFAFAELAARLRALGRRLDTTGRDAPTPASGRAHRARRDPARDRARPDRGARPREFSLLGVLPATPGQALTRDQLLDHAWPFGVAVTRQRRRRLRPLPA